MLLIGCGGLPKGVSKDPSFAFTSPGSTSIGGIFEREAERQGGKSGFVVLPEPRAAFATRAALADFAEETLDVQYYIWSADSIGWTLAERLVNAAERGVRVRFLIDDHVFGKRDSAVAALGAHPNIEIRIFNPAAFRNARTFNVVTNFGRLNHRMHNKVMMMDNAAAVVGGRNIADEYFGLSEKHNNRDFDVFASGPIVRDLSNTFDQFWNSEASIPIEAFIDEAMTMEDFRSQVAQMRRNMKAREVPWPLDEDVELKRSRLHQIKRDLVWAEAQVIYDSPWEPGKEEKEPKLSVVEWMASQLGRVEEELLIESAYFVTMGREPNVIADLVDSGATVRILTNSLASNNVLPAQAGHASHRKRLLRDGVQLYEMRPDADWVQQRAADWGEDAITTLHAKVAVFDRKSAFVGSFNYDPRSANINTEIGLHIESPIIAQQVAAFCDEGVTSPNAYRVTLDEKERGVIWSTEVNGEELQWTVDPETTAGQRFKERLIRLLPIKSQL